MTELNQEVMIQINNLMKMTKKIADKAKAAEIFDALAGAETQAEVDAVTGIVNSIIASQEKAEQTKTTFTDRAAFEKAVESEMAKIDKLIALYHKQNKSAFLAKERQRLTEDMDALVYTLDKDAKNYLSRKGVAPTLVYSASGDFKKDAEKVEIFDTWVKRPETEDQHLFGMTYYPKSEDVVGRKWNTFYDTSVVAEKGDKHVMFLDFVREVICDNNTEYYDYVIKWIAHLMQKPWEKPQTGLSVASRIQGIGKSTFVEILALMIGARNSVMAISEKDVEGSFNYIMAEKLLVNFDEATFAGDHRQNGFMKKLVTQSKSRVERKFGDAKQVEDFSRIIITTNDVANGTPAGFDDRRWLLLEPNGSWVASGKLHALINEIGLRRGEGQQLDFENSDQTAAKNLKWYLQNEVDISDFMPWKLPTQNTGFVTRLGSTWREEPYDAFFMQWCYSGDTNIETSGEGKQVSFSSTAKASDLWFALKEMCKDIPGVKVQKGLFNESLGRFGIKRYQGNGNNYYIDIPSREVVWENIFKHRPRFTHELPPVNAGRPATLTDIEKARLDKQEKQHQLTDKLLGTVGGLPSMKI